MWWIPLAIAGAKLAYDTATDSGKDDATAAPTAPEAPKSTGLAESLAQSAAKQNVENPTTVPDTRAEGGANGPPEQKPFEPVEMTGPAKLENELRFGDLSGKWEPTPTMPAPSNNDQWGEYLRSKRMPESATTWRRGGPEAPQTNNGWRQWLGAKRGA